MRRLLPRIVACSTLIIILNSPVWARCDQEVSSLGSYAHPNGRFETSSRLGINDSEAAAHPDDIWWSPGETIPGVDGEVHALAIYDGKVIAGGEFAIACGTLAHNIAAWDCGTSSWSPLGSGVNAAVWALVVYDGKLIAGGSFTTDGGGPANFVAAWNGQSWSPLGSGVDGPVRDFAIYDGRLIAIGPRGNFFEITAWDGSSWTSIGVTAPGGVKTHCAVTVYDDKLIALGGFISINGVSAGQVAAWDGSSWSALGTGTVDNGVSVRTMTVFQGKLIVGGYPLDSRVDPSLLAWDGVSWTPIEPGMGWGGGGGGGVDALDVYDYDNLLIVGGTGAVSGTGAMTWCNGQSGTVARYLAAWDGSSWSSIGSGVSRRVTAIITDYNLLFVGGDFTAAGNAPAYHIAVWDGAAWLTFGTGAAYEIGDMVVYEDHLVAAGHHPQAETFDPVSAYRIAVWDDGVWRPLAEDLDNSVFALAVYGDELIAGGMFHRIGETPADHIAAWDGSAWAPLGDGRPGVVYALAVYHGSLIAAGTGGEPATRIAAWNGSSWSPLGTGSATFINALTVFDDRLIASRSDVDPYYSDYSWSYVSAWDGFSWSQLGSYLVGTVKALAVYNDQLIAFPNRRVWDEDFSRIAVWDGVSWNYQGPQLYGDVTDVVVCNDQLMAAGAFASIEGVAASRIGAWDGSTWSALGSGVNGTANSLVIQDDMLKVGGEFNLAGGKVSAYLATWDPHPGVPVFVQSFDAIVSKSSVALSWDIISDEDVEGFRIYRTDEAFHNRELVGPGGLVPAGAREYVDTEIHAGHSYEYTLGVVLDDGSEVLSQTLNVRTNAYELMLHQNHPNPFNPATTISFTLPKRQKTNLAVYNIEGKLVTTLVDETLDAGFKEVTWHGKDVRGEQVSTGVYFYRLTAGNKMLTKKMVLLK